MPGDQPEGYRPRQPDLLAGSTSDDQGADRLRLQALRLFSPTIPITVPNVTTQQSLVLEPRALPHERWFHPYRRSSHPRQAANHFCPTPEARHSHKTDCWQNRFRDWEFRNGGWAE